MLYEVILPHLAGRVLSRDPYAPKSRLAFACGVCHAWSRRIHAAATLSCIRQSSHDIPICAGSERRGSLASAFEEAGLDNQVRIAVGLRVISGNSLKLLLGVISASIG